MDSIATFENNFALFWLTPTIIRPGEVTITFTWRLAVKERACPARDTSGARNRP